ncbi:MAG: hypothetical protein ABSD81_05865 [Methanomicrobiales archaeon]|jgi:A/G-specific adenine glycosylase
MEINQQRRHKFSRSVILWSRKHRRHFAWRSRRTPYRIFIAETILRRTTSKAAGRVFNKIIRKYPSIHRLARSSSEELSEDLRPIGLYYQRSIGLIQAAKFIEERHCGNFPKTLEELLKVPHIGEYAARCILSFGMGDPVPVVDSNVIRVTSRVFRDILGEQPSVKQVIEFLSGIIPQKDHQLLNYGLIDLGALVCTYRSCNSQKCPVSGICEFKNTSCLISD